MIPTKPLDVATCQRLFASPSWSKKIIVTPIGCHEWTARLNRSGYGSQTLTIPGESKRVVLAHRVAWVGHHGVDIPAGMLLDHLCRNRACVNPAHLDVVTPRTNAVRGIGPTAENARKTHCNKGHEFIPENTYVRTGSAHRSCRACQRETVARYQARKKAEAAA